MFFSIIENGIDRETGNIYINTQNFGFDLSQSISRWIFVIVIVIILILQYSILKRKNKYIFDWGV